MKKTIIKIKHLNSLTLEHSIRVSILAVQFGEFLNLSQENLLDLQLGGFLHDLGKFYLPEDLFTTAEISISEFELIKKHSALGRLILSAISDTYDLNISTNVIDIISQHHEKENGKGYPSRLSGNKINYLAKIVSICDIFDALYSERSYKKAYSLQRTFEILTTEAQKNNLNAKLVNKFILFINSREKYCHII